VEAEEDEMKLSSDYSHQEIDEQYDQEYDGEEES
jgi:hypothetical protein